MGPKFNHPYDSGEIGLFEVANPSLTESSWTAESVFSKCIIIPGSLQFQDPLPKDILDAEDRIAAFRAHFDAHISKWSVQSLLAPKDEIVFQYS